MFLDDIVAFQRRSVARRKAADALDGAVRVRPRAGSLRGSLAAAFGVIAEVKKSSPSAGLLRPRYRPALLASAYERAGACGVSVLTCSPGFMGRLAHLEAVGRAVALPVLRKDFLIDPWQVREAWAAGADAVLLIAAILDAGTLERLAAEADRFGLETLVEIHDGEDLRKAMDLGGWDRRILGINNRNLRTLRTDLRTSLDLLERVQGDTIVAISESGIRDAADARRLRCAGARGILVGESLLRADDPAAAVAGLLS